MSNNGFYVIDKRRDGILDNGVMGVMVTFLRLPDSEDEITKYIKEIDDLYTKRKHFLIEYDATRLNKKPTAAMLKRLADDVKEKEHLTKTYVLACAVIIDTTTVFGSLLHTLIKSILFIRKPVCPTEFFGSKKEADAYLARHNSSPLV